MFGIPHWIFLIGILSLRIRLKHLFKFTSAIICFFNAQTKQEFNFNYYVILLNVSMKCVFLKHLIIGAFTRLTKFTSPIHPSPKVFSRSNDIVWNIIQNIIEFVICWISCKIRMFIVGFDLKERITLS